MIHFNSSFNKWQFDLPNHNVNKGNYSIIYNQLFIEDQLFILNTDTGDLYKNYIDLNKVDLLKQYNFYCDYQGRFYTRTNGKTIFIHEIIYGVKTNANFVINHIDGNPSNNKLTNLELVTQWFNIALMKKLSGLPIGIRYANSKRSYVITTCTPKANRKQIRFGSQSVNYLQNLHYQFATKSKLVTPERYLKETPNWLPNNIIQFSMEHQQKLDMLITAHLENQNNWALPTILKENLQR